MSRSAALLTLCLLAPAAFAATKREVAITVDDLPFTLSGSSACSPSGMQIQTLTLLEQFLRQKAPLTAFVIAGSCPDLPDEDRRTLLKLWQDSGAELGSHGYAHVGLTKTDPAEFEQDVLKADKELRPLLGSQPLRYFRYPMLQTGPTPEVKARVAAFLTEHGYTNAPATFINADWMFASVYSNAMAKGQMETVARVKSDYVPYMESVVEFYEQRAQEVVGRDIPQILLIHANRLNADFAGDLLSMLKRRGYKFISLAQALKDPAYQLQDDYVGPDGPSWLQRWAIAKGAAAKEAPQEPKWLQGEYKVLERQK
jgi:peptidoglycan/xylan/chitin deacetylase (PgdA/CDA1 family)